MPPKPLISVIVLCYDMRREVPRTLMSLRAEFQRTMAAKYDIELVEMPSDNVLTAKELVHLPPNGRHRLEAENLPLPVAVNQAVARANADHVLICVDGARILSPGLLRAGFQAIRLDPRGTMAVHGLHLGKRPQQDAIADGTHSQAIEDALLEQIEFPSAPHRLWSISCWAGSSCNGVFGGMAESCALMIPKARFDELGGYDEAITTPGGGLANCDFFARATQDVNIPLFVPIGQGTFHQCHGGATTDRPKGAFEDLKAEFEAQTGRPFRFAQRRAPQYLGFLAPGSMKLLQTSVHNVLEEAEALFPPAAAKTVNAALDRGGVVPQKGITQPQTVLIAGMHRSGTSYLARQFAMNGFDVPGMMMGGTALSNPEGHFEPLEIVGLHNAGLRAHGTSWHGLSHVTWAPEVNQGRFTNALGHILSQLAQMEEAGRWIIKDPRICHFTPVWDLALKRLGWTADRLVVMRDPMLVAKSLNKRDSMAVGHGLLLWARYVLSLWPWVSDPQQVLCIDTMRTQDIEQILAGFCDAAPDIEPLRPVTWPETDDPISLAYRRFTQDRDGDALIAALRGELGFAERYADYVRQTDRQTRLNF